MKGDEKNCVQIHKSNWPFVFLWLLSLQYWQVLYTRISSDSIFPIGRMPRSENCMPFMKTAINLNKLN